MLCIIGCYNIIFLDPMRFLRYSVLFSQLSDDVFSMRFIEIFAFHAPLPLGVCGQDFPVSEKNALATIPVYGGVVLG
jgi:hypothetical protein